MKVGKYVDPLKSGNSAIDIKGMMKQAGYIVSQGAIDSLKEIPMEIKTEIANIEKDQVTIERLKESKEFICPYCKEKNISDWRKDADGEFLICGACNLVVEVR